MGSNTGLGGSKCTLSLLERVEMLSLFGSEGALLEPELRWADEAEDRREPPERWPELLGRCEVERCGEPTGDKSLSLLELVGLAWEAWVE